MAEFTFRERKTSGQHLDKKVDRIIQGLLNEMTITVDNTHEEDVTLPEMIDRIYTRLLSVENKLKETGNDEIDSLLNSGNVKFYASLVQFPKPDSEDAKEDVLYIDKSSGAVYLYDKISKSYKSQSITFTSPEGKTMTEIIQESIEVLDGGNANYN